jgi:hypothetical protein
MRYIVGVEVELYSFLTDVMFITLRLLYSRERFAVPIEYRPVWNPGSFWTAWRGEKVLPLAEC